MHVYQTMICSVTAPGTTLTPATPINGSSLTTLSFPETSNSHIYYIHALKNALGPSVIRGQKFHDTNGIREVCGANSPIPALMMGRLPLLASKETLQVEIAGSAVGGDIDLLQILCHYEDVPGIQTRYIDIDELGQRQINYFVRQYNTTGIAGAFSADINLGTGDATGFNTFKADREYAIVGFEYTTTPLGFYLVGPCTGGLRYGQPHYGETDRIKFFMRLAYNLQRPAIPVMHGQDAQNTFFSTVQDNTTTGNISIAFIELANAPVRDRILITG